jgi:hypothetical protein
VKSRTQEREFGEQCGKDKAIFAFAHHLNFCLFNSSDASTLMCDGFEYQDVLVSSKISLQSHVGAVEVLFFFFLNKILSSRS